jgi:uncharacterized protein YciI
MWYMIFGADVPQSLAARKACRAPHLARIEASRHQGRLLLAGPLPAIDALDPGPAGFTGSLIVADFDSLASARSWVDADPYLPAGVWQSAEARPFLKACP